jgi:hypothetical protein
MAELLKDDPKLKIVLKEFPVLGPGSVEAAKVGKSRATRYTPATTMVAAWIKALTGVGPSMASGSQT